MASIAPVRDFSRPAEQFLPLEASGVRVLLAGQVITEKSSGLCMVREISGKGICFESRLRFEEGCTAVISLRGNRIAEGLVVFDPRGRSILEWKSMPRWAHAMVISEDSGR